MKKLVSILMALLLILAISTPTFAEEKSEVSTDKIDTSDWVTYKIKELGMSIKLPPDMKVYTRESIKLGNVNEDENFEKAKSQFQNEKLFFKGVSKSGHFTFYIDSFPTNSLILPNLYAKDEPIFNKVLDIMNRNVEEKIDVPFITENANFIKAQSTVAKKNADFILHDYSTTINYHWFDIYFLCNEKNITQNTTNIYDQIVGSIIFSNYKFNARILLVVSFIITIFLLLKKLLKR